ncbi:hypothetical protein BD410DRAFT_790249 [Rickenella mellea]|uniref:Uncharacterized protein n=1 Tax=Rickenella mellea TaxID=50990 RepID=A0A4Y7PZT2_9AGAM|nr:hypothetical protein BD410DRAFT_790249 [Rickenella mellea]
MENVLLQADHPDFLAQTTDSSSLYILAFVFIFLFISLFAWLVLSSCLGTQILNPLRELWDSAMRTPQTTHYGPMSRRRREFGLSEGEIWEMEHR